MFWMMFIQPVEVQKDIYDKYQGSIKLFWLEVLVHNYIFVCFNDLHVRLGGYGV